MPVGSKHRVRRGDVRAAARIEEHATAITVTAATALALSWAGVAAPSGPMTLLRPFLLLACVLIAAVIVADDPGRRAAAVAGVMGVPVGLPTIVASRPAGAVLVGTVVLLTSSLTLAGAGPRGSTRIGRAANAALLLAGTTLLFTPVPGSRWGGAFVLVPLLIVVVVVVAAFTAVTHRTGPVAGQYSPNVTTLLAAALVLLPAMTLARSVVPDVFLRAAAGRLPADLVRLVVAALGTAASSAGARAFAVTILIAATLILILVVLPDLTAVPPVARGLLLAIGGAVTLLVLVARACGVFDVTPVAASAPHLLPLLVLGPAVVLALTSPRTTLAPRRRWTVDAVIAGLVAFAHSLVLLEAAAAGDGLASRAASAWWVVGSLAGSVLAVAIAVAAVGTRPTAAHAAARPA